MRNLNQTSILYCLAVPFFGGFLGAIGVAGVRCFLAVIGVTLQFNNLSFQWIQDFSWGGAMWGFIPAIFLIKRKGNANIYFLSFVTWFIAVSYGLFVLQGLPLMISLEIIVAYVISLVYAFIMWLTLSRTRVLVEHKFIFENLLPRPVDVTKHPRQFFTCPHCNRQFEGFTDFSIHVRKHNDTL